MVSICSFICFHCCCSFTQFLFYHHEFLEHTWIHFFFLIYTQITYIRRVVQLSRRIINVPGAFGRCHKYRTIIPVNDTHKFLVVFAICRYLPFSFSMLSVGRDCPSIENRSTEFVIFLRTDNSRSIIHMLLRIYSMLYIYTGFHIHIYSYIK